MLTCQQVILYGKKVDLSRGLAIFIDFISEGRGQRIKKASANRRCLFLFYQIVYDADQGRSDANEQNGH